MINTQAAENKEYITQKVTLRNNDRNNVNKHTGCKYNKDIQLIGK